MPPSKKASEAGRRVKRTPKTSDVTVENKTFKASKPVALPSICGKVDAKQAHKAFRALAAYTERRQNEKSSNELPLGGGDSLGASKDTENTVWVQITVKQLDPQRKVKPARIPLAHPLLDASASVCLLTKDPQREYKDLLQEKNIRTVNRVVGVAKLKGKFRPFDARRELVREHDLFLADERIVPMLPQLCGSVFYKDRKFPIPIDLENKKRLAETIERAIASTYYMQNKGSCSTIKIGFLNRHSAEELVDNLARALPAIVARIPGKWSNVQNIEVKTGRSAALPIWNCRLVEGDGDDVRWSASEAKKASEEELEKLKDFDVEGVEDLEAFDDEPEDEDDGPEEDEPEDDDEPDDNDQESEKDGDELDNDEPEDENKEVDEDKHKARVPEPRKRKLVGSVPSIKKPGAKTPNTTAKIARSAPVKLSRTSTTKPVAKKVKRSM